jgi:hypothetical protein
MEEMKTFECAICGKLHNSVQARINCETACLKEQEALAKASKEAEKNKEVERINAALDKLIADFVQIINDIDKFYEKYDKEEENFEDVDTFIQSIIDYIF